jgi:N-acetylglucosaminyl-diphospho-decaprenol L-rhamnosyltransferase
MVDVVVVTADSRDLVLRCLDRLDDPAIAATIVVDNASSDGTAAAVERRHEEAIVVRLDEPQNLAAAYNRGAVAGSSELILFLNDDVLATPGAVSMLVAALAALPGAVAAAGRLVDPETGETQPEYQPRAFPGVLTFAAALAGIERLWAANPWTGAHHRRPLDDRVTVTVDRPAGACLLVRRTVFEAVGGWDEGFPLWYEDVDLARRLRRHGTILYAPSAVFEHIGGWSTRRLERAEVVERTYLGTLRYGAKHFGPMRRLALGGLYAAVGAARARTSRDPELAAVYRKVRRRALSLLRGSPR